MLFPQRVAKQQNGKKMISPCASTFVSQMFTGPSKPFFSPPGGWLSSLETFLSPSPDALCLQKIAHDCSTFSKSSLEKERQIQLSSQTCFTALLPSTSVSIAFWLCTEKGAKIHHKTTIPFQLVTAPSGLVCLIWRMEVFHIPWFSALCWLQ